MRTNHVLIDYESVQPASLSALAQEHFKVTIFVGERQAKIGFDCANALQHMGERGQYIKIVGMGPNALDFHIAFYLGRLAAAEPDAYFHVISKDTGFDPLIAHLKRIGILAARSIELSQLPILKLAMAQSPEERQAAILANLQQRGASKPRTVKTLSSTINALFQKSLEEQEIASLLQRLEQQGIISITGTKVSYLPI